MPRVSIATVAFGVIGLASAQASAREACGASGLCEAVGDDAVSWLQLQKITGAQEGNISEHLEPHSQRVGRCCRKGVCDQRSIKKLNPDAMVAAMDGITPPGTGWTITLLNGCGENVFQHSRGTKYCPDINCDSQVSGWTADTVYGAFSNSKVVSASVFLAAIVEPGLATLDSPLKTMLPDIFHGENVYAEATPRQILSHTSGWTGEMFTYTRCFQTYPSKDNPYLNDTDSSFTLEDCIKQLAVAPPVGRPGERFFYTDNSFEVLSLVVERLAGLTFEEAFQKYIGKPLGMSSSSYVCDWAGSTNAHAHPADGLCTTANDFPKIVQVLSRQGRACEGETILRRGSVKSILTDETRNARLYDSPDMMFALHLPGTPCVTNTLPSNASVFGYGFGAIHFWGWRAKLWGHPGSLGSAWMVSRGRYSVLFSMSQPLSEALIWPIAALGAFEAENFPEEPLCPDPTIKLDDVWSTPSTEELTSVSSW